MPSVERLEWDSRFFGISIGRVSLSEATPNELVDAVRWADDERIECLYWLIDGNDRSSPHAAETYGFHLVDVQLTLETGLPSAGEASNDSAMVKVRPSEPGDLPALLAMARESHRDSRFYYDGHFSEEKCGSLYEEWIHRARRESDMILVAEHAFQPAGYCVCHLSAQGVGSIGLIAVDRRWHRSRIGTALVTSALRHFERSGMRSATVVTQGRNIPSQRLYQRTGFVTRSMKLWYHRWIGTDS
jgi:dTDP-4-amino-4,6-dideoxy-D-galactose acyltransferase